MVSRCVSARTLGYQTWQACVELLESGLKRGFVREELLIVPPDTQLPPVGVNMHSWHACLISSWVWPLALSTRSTLNCCVFFWLVIPLELNIAASTTIILNLFGMQDVVDLQVKSKPFCSVLSLEGHKPLLNISAELLFSGLCTSENSSRGTTTLPSWCIYPHATRQGRRG